MDFIMHCDTHVFLSQTSDLADTIKFVYLIIIVCDHGDRNAYLTRAATVSDALPPCLNSKCATL